MGEGLTAFRTYASNGAFRTIKRTTSGQEKNQSKENYANRLHDCGTLHRVSLSENFRDFLVVAGAAAPIIALANQLTISDSIGTLPWLGLARRDDSRTPKGRRHAQCAFWLTVALYIIAAINLLAQTYALFNALRLLADDKVSSWYTEAVLVTTGLVLVGVSALVSGEARSESARMEAEALAADQRRSS